jgi:hypothetical protein
MNKDISNLVGDIKNQMKDYSRSLAPNKELEKKPLNNLNLGGEVKSPTFVDLKDLNISMKGSKLNNVV